MKLSVVIPAYNEEKLIGACLEALTHQTEPADEIIVVDNNCQDKTVEIAKKFPVRIIKEKTQGISYARNAGFDAAKYELIGRIDADTIVGPTWVETVKKSFSEPQTLAITGPTFFRGLGWDWLTERIHTLIFYDFLRLVHGHYLLYGSDMAIRKSAWEKIKTQVIMDNKEVHEDLDLAIHLAKIGKIKLVRSLMVGVSNRRVLGFPGNLEYLTRYFKMLFRLFSGTYYKKAKTSAFKV